MRSRYGPRREQIPPIRPAGTHADKVASCPIRSASRSTPWAATMARRCVLPGADISLTRHPDIEFVLFGDEAVVRPLLEQHATAEGGLARSSTPMSRSAWTTSRARRCATAAGSRRCGSPSTR